MYTLAPWLNALLGPLLSHVKINDDLWHVSKRNWPTFSSILHFSLMREKKAAVTLYG